MCEPISATTAVTIGLTAASAAESAAAAAAQQKAQKKTAGTAAFTQNESTLKQEAAEFTNQENTMRYQDTTWQADIDFGTKTLSYQATEFSKQADYVSKVGTAIETNENAAFGQTAIQLIQKNIAITLGEANTNASAAQERAKAQVGADARGVSGNSVDAIIDDVTRQQGQVITVMEMNRAGVNTQGAVDMASVKAGADAQLGQLQSWVKTYSPSTPIRAPGPVSGVQDASLVSTAPRSDLGDSLAIVGAGLGGAVSGFNAVSSLSGTSTKDLLSGIGRSLRIT